MELMDSGGGLRQGRKRESTEAQNGKMTSARSHLEIGSPFNLFIFYFHVPPTVTSWISSVEELILYVLDLPFHDLNELSTVFDRRVLGGP
jgi:hypothetical protein